MNDMFKRKSFRDWFADPGVAVSILSVLQAGDTFDDGMHNAVIFFLSLQHVNHFMHIYN